MSEADQNTPNSEQEAQRLKREWLEHAEKSPASHELRILERCREIAAGSLSGSLKGMLENLVTELFDLADKAIQNDVQNLYFDAMAVARDQHARIEQAFRRHFIRSFDAAVHGADRSVQNSNINDSGEFTLVDTDDLEESIAIQEMTAKIKSSARDELFALEKRMGVLLHDEALTEHNNPLGPEIFADAFVAACGETDAALKVRLLFVTMWDRHMQNGVLSTYHEVNQYLVEKDILPKIKREVVKRRTQDQVEQIATAAAHAAVQAMAMSEEDENVFDVMQQLMQAATQRSGFALPAAGASVGVPGLAGIPGTPGVGGVAGGPAAPGSMMASRVAGLAMPGSGGSGAAVSGASPTTGALPAEAGALPVGMLHNPMVVTRLTQLQQDGGASVLGEGVGAAVVNLDQVSMLRELKNVELGAALGTADAMTIDIVAMLFDFIFDDKRVPDTIKVLLGRLQIPVLKAAMLDQAFFSKKTHPTRRLLNAMAEAAYEWGETIDRDSPLYAKVEELVQRINEDFEDNLVVFELALVEFEQFLAEREQDAENLVAVSRDMIEAREREQIKEEDAQRASEDAVRARASDSEVPDTVRLFLCQEWVKPLHDAYLSGGGECHAWLTAVALMDDLIWSVRPKLTRESRQYMVKALPGLLRRLQEGMKQAQIEQTVREKFMSQLVHCHAAAVKAGFQAPVEPQPVPEEAWKSAVLARQANLKQENQESAVVLPFTRPALSRDERDVKLEIIKAQNASGHLEVEEITIANLAWHDNEDDEMQTTQDIPVEKQVRDEQSSKQMVAELKPGTWVEFTHEGEEPLRAKLKWISPLKSAYLFTDRQGKRAATMPLQKLEAAFRIGSARIVEDVPLLDRAVDNVIETLKRAVA